MQLTQKYMIYLSRHAFDDFIVKNRLAYNTPIL